MSDQKIDEILACPACAERPKLIRNDSCYTCSKCKREYPIAENGIAKLLVDPEHES